MQGGDRSTVSGNNPAKRGRRPEHVAGHPGANYAAKGAVIYAGDRLGFGGSKPPRQVGILAGLYKRAILASVRATDATPKATPRFLHCMTSIQPILAYSTVHFVTNPCQV